MISDEERRKFAENLRYIAQHPPEWATSSCAIAEVFDTNYPLLKDSGELFDMLADLIDRPTCRNVSDHQDVFTCSECRCKVEIIGEECNEYGECFCVPFMPSFCPNCGAEVMW